MYATLLTNVRSLDPRRLVNADTLRSGKFRRLRGLYACRLFNTDTLNACKLCGLRLLHPSKLFCAHGLDARPLRRRSALYAGGFFNAYTLYACKLRGSCLLYASGFAKTDTLHPGGFFGPPLLRGHARCTITLELLLRLLKRTLRSNSLNISKLAAERLFCDALLNRLPATAKSASSDRLSVTCGLLPPKLLNGIFLLATHNGLHIGVHVASKLVSTKLPCWIKCKFFSPTKLVEPGKRGCLTFAERGKFFPESGVKTRVWAHLRPLKPSKRRYCSFLKPPRLKPGKRGCLTFAERGKFFPESGVKTRVWAHLRPLKPSKRRYCSFLKPPRLKPGKRRNLPSLKTGVGRHTGLLKRGGAKLTRHLLPETARKAAETPHCTGRVVEPGDGLPGHAAKHLLGQRKVRGVADEPLPTVGHIRFFAERRAFREQIFVKRLRPTRDVLNLRLRSYLLATLAHRSTPSCTRRIRAPTRVASAVSPKQACQTPLGAGTRCGGRGPPFRRARRPSKRIYHFHPPSPWPSRGGWGTR